MLNPLEINELQKAMIGRGVDYETSELIIRDFRARCVKLLGTERYHEIMQAEREGRLVILPCKVGDIIYGFHNGKTILPMVAKWIETNEAGWTVAAQYAPMAPKFYLFEDFGKTVFLSRDEAEKALEEAK